MRTYPKGKGKPKSMAFAEGGAIRSESTQMAQEKAKMASTRKDWGDAVDQAANSRTKKDYSNLEKQSERYLAQDANEARAKKETGGY